ncbi:ABC-F family ATP-binding cassette domain-containing protein [Klenkia brasiliensis]|uniref:ABC-F family ATP-binding cassette domain-containing protein n=1 Tax=Klenkia brasiliensis TaxID=333142 RepID=UPI000B81ABB0|nr:ABC-F family ATP-binding cassette domain-containing protein [Klenkia brasiliensis]
MVKSAWRPALQESAAGWLRSLRAQMVEVMTTSGSADSEIDARLPLAIISGVDVDSLGDIDGPRRGLARTALGRLFHRPSPKVSK